MKVPSEQKVKHRPCCDISPAAWCDTHRKLPSLVTQGVVARPGMAPFRRTTFLTCLCLLWEGAGAVAVDRCCPVQQAVSATSGLCEERTEAGQDWLAQLPPLVFSVASEGYVNASFEVEGVGRPSCGPEQSMETLSQRGADAEDWMLLLQEEGGAQLYISRHAYVVNEFCVEELQDGSGKVVGSVAQHCVIDRCQDKICIPACCPAATLWQEESQACQPKEGYELKPPFVDQRQNPVSTERRDDYLLLYGEPDCSSTHTYKGATTRLSKDSEYDLRESGLLHIGQLAFNHTQFCLQDQENSDGKYRMEARVCTLTLEEHSSRIETVNGNIIPALFIISECCLFLTFLLHVIVPEFRRQIFGWMKMCMVASLFLGYQWFIIIFFGDSLLVNQHQGLCQTLGLLMQFSFLAAFCWMSAMAWEVWATFRQLKGMGAWEARQRRQKSRFWLINIYCWGFPLLVSTATIAIQFLPDELTQDLIQPGLGLDTCFFSSYLAHVVYFHGIIAVLLFGNLTLFLLSAYSLLFGIWAGSGEDGSRQTTRQMFWVVLELFLVMGLTWMADVVSLGINWSYGAQYAGYEILFFDVLNSLQGLLIFLVLVCKPRMRSMIRASLGPACRTAFSCLQTTKARTNTVDSPREKQSNPAVSPMTGTTTISLPHSPSSQLVEQSSTRRSSSLLDSFTPTWKRGSYNLGFEDKEECVNIHTLSLSESKC